MRDMPKMIFSILLSILEKQALVYAAQSMKLELTPEKRSRLLKSYLSLKPWPDAVAGLRKLKDAGVKIITIANFSHHMLKTNADGAGITNLFDELLSTEADHTYKPDARAYELGMKKLKLKKEEIAFAALADGMLMEPKPLDIQRIG